MLVISLPAFLWCYHGRGARREPEPIACQHGELAGLRLLGHLGQIVGCADQNPSRIGGAIEDLVNTGRSARKAHDLSRREHPLIPRPASQSRRPRWG